MLPSLPSIKFNPSSFFILLVEFSSSDEVLSYLFTSQEAYFVMSLKLEDGKSTENQKLQVESMEKCFANLEKT